MGKLRVRDVLNEIKWSGRYKASEVEVYFISRGYEGGIEKVSFTDILELKRGSIIVKRGREEKYIPHHRIVKIAKSSGEVIWSK